MRNGTNYRAVAFVARAHTERARLRAQRDQAKQTEILDQPVITHSQPPSPPILYCGSGAPLAVVGWCPQSWNTNNMCLSPHNFAMPTTSTPPRWWCIPHRIRKSPRCDNTRDEQKLLDKKNKRKKGMGKPLTQHVAHVRRKRRQQRQDIIRRYVSKWGKAVLSRLWRHA